MAEISEDSGFGDAVCCRGLREIVANSAALPEPPEEHRRKKRIHWRITARSGAVRGRVR